MATSGSSMSSRELPSSPQWFRHCPDSMFLQTIAIVGVFGWEQLSFVLFPHSATGSLGPLTAHFVFSFQSFM